MKKIGLFIIGILFIFPITVFAANPQVTEVTASANGTTISYSGTTEEGLTAVMCKLYKGNDEVKKISSEVNNKAFSGTFTAPSNGTYKVYCARYEGGTIVASSDVTISAVTSNSNTASNTVSNATSSTTSNNATEQTSSNAKSNSKEDNPKTLDNIGLFVGIFAAALIGIVIAIVVKRKKRI